MSLLRGIFNLTPMLKSRLKSIRVKLSWMSWIIYAEGFNRLSMGVQDFQ
jgi:hypothetical protein